MPLLDTSASAAKKMFDVNVFAIITMTQAFAPLLIKSKGTIVNIGSILGHTPFLWSGYYNASKAAVNLLTDQLRLELSPWGIKVILVVAGAIRTQFFENLPESPRLPENSVYAPARAEVEKVMSGVELEKTAADLDVSAEQIVINALKAHPKKHQWVGTGASTVWFASTFGWSTIWVCCHIDKVLCSLLTRHRTQSYLDLSTFQQSQARSVQAPRRLYPHPNARRFIVPLLRRRFNMGFCTPSLGLRFTVSTGLVPDCKTNTRACNIITGPPLGANRSTSHTLKTRRLSQIYETLKKKANNA